MTSSPMLVTASAARLDAAARLILRDPELARDAVQNALAPRRARLILNGPPLAAPHRVIGNAKG